MKNDIIMKNNIMTINHIQSIVKRIIREKFLVNSDIKNDDILVEVGLDSMKMIQLVVELEDYFGFEFEDEKLSYGVLRNIEEISEYVNQRLATDSNF